MIKRLAALFLLLAAPCAYATVVIDTTSVGPVLGTINPSTWTITVGASGVNRMVVLGCFHSAGSLTHISSATVGASSMTFIRRDTHTTDETELWYSTGAATGSLTVSVYSAGRHYCGATSLFNVNPSTPVDVSTGGVTSGTTPNISFATTVSSDMLVDVLGEAVTGGPDLTPATGQALQWIAYSTTGFTSEAGSTKLTTIAGNQTMGWVLPNSNQDISVVAVENSTGSPNVTTLSPSSATINTGAFTLTINGDHFVSGSTVSWNAVGRTTTFVSSTQLTITVTLTDIASIGTATILVTNPDGGTSAPITYAITGDVTLVWATDGGYKPTRDDLYGTLHSSITTATRIWDGTTAKPFQGQNELNGFALILENNTVIDSTGVSVGYPRLTGPNGYVISSTPAAVSTLWDWRNRPIEVYVVKYLQILGLTRTLWGNYDEQSVPQRMRATYTVAGTGQGVRTGGWTTRADHDKYYPDPMVPLEAVAGSTFTVYASSSQAIWVDIYTAKVAPPGLYTGSLPIYENGALSRTVPISLTVYPVMMPDTPYSKSYGDLSMSDISLRHHGNAFPSYGGIGDQYTQTRIHYYQLMHRFGITPVGDSSQVCGTLIANAPCPEFQLGLSGALYADSTGYANAPGVGVPDPMYSMFTYGSWASSSWLATYDSTCQNAKTWVQWFQQNYPKTEYWWYVADEPTDLTLTNQYSTWISTCASPGNLLKPFVTARLTRSITQTPNIAHVATSQALGDIPSVSQSALNFYNSTSSRTITSYGGNSPFTGSMATEDDGIAFRVREWAHFKKKFDHTFVWDMNYWKNLAGGSVNTNVWNSALTFGFNTTPADPTYGNTSFNYANGDGVFIYPGTDLTYSTASYNADTGFPGWRLMMWRRGINDYSLLTMASKYDPVAVDALVQQTIPKVLWEYGVFDTGDPTYQYGGPSWSIDPNVWELARERLYQIILNSSRR